MRELGLSSVRTSADAKWGRACHDFVPGRSGVVSPEKRLGRMSTGRSETWADTFASVVTCAVSVRGRAVRAVAEVDRTPAARRNCS
jgi:hypothetical protein